MPSMPSHQNVLCGNRLTSLHDIFWVRNDETPASFRICGSAAEYPNTSGSQRSVVSRPNSSRKNRLPCTIWRTSDSPDGMLQSASTHMLPIGSNRPASHLRADAVVERRVELLDPVVLLRLRRREVVLGVVLHEPQRVRERARTLALRLADRPEPRGVDVRVADRAHAVRVGRGRAREHAARARRARHRHAGRRRRRRSIRSHAASSASSTRRCRGVVAGQHVDELREHQHVEVQRLDVTADRSRARPGRAGRSAGRSRRA